MLRARGAWGQLAVRTRRSQPTRCPDRSPDALAADTLSQVRGDLGDGHRRMTTMTENRAAFDRAIAHWNAGDLDAYLERIHQPQYDALVAASCESWKPVDAADVVVLKEEISEKLKDATKEKLEAIVAELAKPSKV